MAISASTVSDTQTLEEFRLEYNKLQSDVSTIESSPTFGASISFEGDTADAYETTLAVTDPTADRTITLPNATGTVLLSGTAFDIDDLDIDGGTDIGADIVDADLFIIDDGAGGTNRKTAASRIKTYIGVSAGALDLANLDIDGGTDIGAAIVDADLFIVDDGAGGTNRKTAASRIATYVGASAGAFSLANLDIDGGTDINAAIVDADLFIIDDGAGGTNRKTAASRIATYVGASAGAFSLANLDIDGGTDIGAAVVAADLFIVDDGAGGTNRKTAASRIKTFVEASTVAVTGNVTATGTVEPAGDTAASDNAAIGYTSAEGLILTGQGSTSDITIKNDADADVITVATGTTNVDVVGDLTAGTLNADGNTAAGDNAAMGYTSAEGLILTGQGSTSDITIKNDADADVITVATGTTNVVIAGDLTISGDDLIMGTNTSGAALIADGTNFNPVVISGDISINTSGVAAIGAGVIVNADIADDAIDSEHYADGSIDNAHIADDAIDSEHYADGSIDEAHLADNAVTLAKMAGGTDGQIITYDASGDPVAVGPGTDGQVLTSTGAGSPPAFEDAGSGVITSYTNSTNNRVITSVDSATVNSEANLTFDGSVLAVSGNVTATGTVEPAGDTAASDNAAIGYTSGEGLILTGQGSTNDITIKNDADADVITIATGTTNVDVVGDLTAATLNADGDTAAGDNAAIGYTAALGVIVTGQGSTNDITLVNDADATVLAVPTGTTTVNMAGAANITSTLTLSSDIVFDGGNPEVRGGDTDGVLILTPNTNALGAVVTLYGDTHGSKAGDFEFYDDETLVANYDASASKWYFKGIDYTIFDIAGHYGDELDDGLTPIQIIGNASFAFKIDSITYMLGTGAMNVDLQIGTTSVTDLDDLSITTTEQSTTAGTAANSVAAGDDVRMVVTNISDGDKNFSFTIHCTRT